KARWCDKSTNNVEHLGVLGSLFPDAQYVCLHRSCLDVVYSLLELFRFGFTGRYAQMAARSPENTIDAMIATWTDATQAILEFEAAHAHQCIRVRYEDFVADAKAAAERIFSFLGLDGAASAVDAMFATSHDPGPGDLKIQFTREVQQGRIGQGARLPRSRISPDRLKSVNALHRQLGYTQVAREASPLETVLNASARTSKSVRPGDWG